jgi:hypothetical protein
MHLDYHNILISERDNHNQDQNRNNAIKKRDYKWSHQEGVR